MMKSEEEDITYQTVYLSALRLRLTHGVLREAVRLDHPSPMKSG